MVRQYQGFESMTLTMELATTGGRRRHVNIVRPEQMRGHGPEVAGVEADAIAKAGSYVLTCVPRAIVFCPSCPCLAFLLSAWLAGERKYVLGYLINLRDAPLDPEYELVSDYWIRYCIYVLYELVVVYYYYY